MKPFVKIDLCRHLIEHDIWIRHMDERKLQPLQIDDPLGRLIAPADAMKKPVAFVGQRSHEPIIGEREWIEKSRPAGAFSF